MGGVKQKINGIYKDLTKRFRGEKYKRNHSSTRRPEKVVEAILSFESLDFSFQCLKNKKLKLSKQQKIEIIAKSKDPAFIQMCLNEQEIGLSEIDLVNIIVESKDVTLIKSYLESKSQKLSNDEKIELLLSIDDVEYVKEYVSKNDLGLDSIDRSIILKSEELNHAQRFLKKLMSDAIFRTPEEQAKVTMYNTNDFEYMSQEESILRSKKHPEIDNISQLSVEDVLASPEMKKISVGNYEYTRREYLQLRSAVDEILEGIEIPGLEPSEQLEAFEKIYSRLAQKISYDDDAIENKNEKRDMGAWNLYSGLVKDKCVCAGYANILRNVLACVGIDSIVVSGGRNDSKVGHAWNQVNLGGVWFNVDLTNDRDSIIEEGPDLDIRDYLRADDKFKNNITYSREQTPRKECTENPHEYFEDVREKKYSLGRMVKRFSKETKLQIRYLQDVFRKLQEDLSTSLDEKTQGAFRQSYIGMEVMDKSRKKIAAKGDEYSIE